MSLTDRDLKVIWHPYTQMKTAAAADTYSKGRRCLFV